MLNFSAKNDLAHCKNRDCCCLPKNGALYCSQHFPACFSNFAGSVALRVKLCIIFGLLKGKKNKHGAYDWEMFIAQWTTKCVSACQIGFHAQFFDCGAMSDRLVWLGGFYSIMFAMIAGSTGCTGLKNAEEFPCVPWSTFLEVI